MEARFVLFRSSYSPWETIMAAAAEFASTLSPEQLISISHSCDKSDSVVAVWYWAKTNSPQPESRTVHC